MQRSYFLSCCTSVVPRIIFKTHLAEEKMGLLFSDLNWIEHSNDLNGYFLHVFGTNLVYYAVSLPKGLWLKIAFSIPPSNTVSRPFMREGRRWSKVVCPEWERCRPISLKPQGWLRPTPDLWAIVLTYLPAINLPWKLSAISWTNRSTWSSLNSFFNNDEAPQCYLKDLATSSVHPSPHTVLGPMFKFLFLLSGISCLWQLIEGEPQYTQAFAITVWHLGPCVLPGSLLSGIPSFFPPWSHFTFQN